MKINWQILTREFQVIDRTLARTARRLGLDAENLRRLHRGDIEDPKASVGLALLMDYSRLKMKGFGAVVEGLKQ